MAVSASSAGTPVASRRSSETSRPATAASSRISRVPAGSRSSRVRSTSPTDGGTGAESRCRSWAPTIQRDSSTTKNGLPPVRSWTVDASDRSPGEPSCAVSRVATSSSPRPVSRRMVVLGSRARRARQSVTASGSSSPTVRAVTTSRTGARGRCRASRPSSCTDVVSAPCRSSRTTSTGCAGPRSPPAGSRRSWKRRNRAASASSSPAGLSSCWPSCSSACVHGHRAGAPASSAQRLQATDQPAARAASAAASASRVLPIPASPSTTTTAARPALTCPATACRWASSVRRPTSPSVTGTGDGAGVTGMRGRGMRSSSVGSWFSTARSRSRSSGPGSMPSSSRSSSAQRRRASRASAWRSAA